ncbi:MAG: hypothetical protein K9N06_05790 [Candidatus Cloacimonetes bacterium]|nr:hypothetical protein [Candidatus Cloacimonadota bacterium]
MKSFSKTRKDYTGTKSRREITPIDFFVNMCDIHGRLGKIVYRHKRNGKFYSYPYEYVPKYAATVLSRRSECVFRAVAKVTNSSQPGYQSIIDKMYYYSPYFVFPGNYKFSCNTFFKLRKKGNYSLQIDEGLQIGLALAPRSSVNLGFNEPGEHTVKCYKGEMLYCERKISVLSAECDLETVYADWFAEHLTEILLLPEPRFAPLEKYFRCVIPPNWITSMAGECENIVFYSTRNSHLDFGLYKKKIYMYSRSLASFKPSEQNDYFGKVQPRVTHCWSGAAAEFRQVWEKYYSSWFKVNSRKVGRVMRKHNLWSKLVYRAAKILEFDLETLNQENWLPGINTIGELIAVASMSNFGLTSQELETKLF